MKSDKIVLIAALAYRARDRKMHPRCSVSRLVMQLTAFIVNASTDGCRRIFAVVILYRGSCAFVRSVIVLGGKRVFARCNSAEEESNRRRGE